MSGVFITFEGPEGSGKSTQMDRLEARLQGLGLGIVRTREPGGTPTGETIRDILQHNLAGEPLCDEAEVLLFSASRAQLVRRVVEPALERGEWVLCDRFVDSTSAYQGFGRGLGAERLEPIHQFAVGGTMPELTVILDLDVATGMARVQRRAEQSDVPLDRIEREALTFHERVRQGYLALAQQHPERCVVVDADQSLDAVTVRIWAEVAGRLGSRLPEGVTHAG